MAPTSQEERRVYLIRELLAERAAREGRSGTAATPSLPASPDEQRHLLRGLVNVRPPWPASAQFLSAQDAYLREETRRRGITDVADLTPIRDGLCLWQGDITTLRCDAIVNAANGQMLGCFHPNHGCIDNAIHTFAGVQLRASCARLMEELGTREVQPGEAYVTPAFNLPSSYVIHTVGPIVGACPTRRDAELLASCYRSCLEVAERRGMESLAFCCISTGEFCFPNHAAAQIAIQTVEEYRRRTHSRIKVVFDVFKNRDREIYEELLAAERPSAPERG